MTDITDLLEDRAASYEASGPSAHHTAALLRRAKHEIEILRKPGAQIDDVICLAIDRWRAAHPELLVSEILQALEKVRHALTEAWVKNSTR